MKLKLQWLAAAGAIATIAAPGARGAFVVFTDQATFLAQTGASSSTGVLPNLGLVSTPATRGGTTFTLGPSATQLYIGGEWTTRIPGNDLAISGPENLDAVFSGPVYSAGFQFAEPRFDPNVNAAFIDSTFTVTAKHGATVVDLFTFNAPDDTSSFYGIWADAPFDRLEIRETVGGAGNEFFGQFFTGVTPVPEPAQMAVLGLAALSFAVWRGHSRQRTS